METNEKVKTIMERVETAYKNFRVEARNADVNFTYAAWCEYAIPRRFDHSNAPFDSLPEACFVPGLADVYDYEGELGRYVREAMKVRGTDFDLTVIMLIQAKTGAIHFGRLPSTTRFYKQLSAIAGELSKKFRISGDGDLWIPYTQDVLGGKAEEFQKKNPHAAIHRSPGFEHDLAELRKHFADYLGPVDRYLVEKGITDFDGAVKYRLEELL